MQQRILLIANAASVWTRELVRNIHAPLGQYVTLLSFDRPGGQAEAFYAALGTELFVLGGGGRADKIAKAGQLLRFSLAHRGRFELVIVHSPPHSVQALFLNAALRVLNCPVFTVFWGSDIQAISEAEAKKLQAVLRVSTAVNLSTRAMRSDFKRLFPACALPVFEAKFGLSAFEYIDWAKAEYGRDRCLTELGLDPGKTCIAVGYNGGEQQQHLPAIRALAALSDEEKSGIQLLLHMGYKKDAAYMEKVRTAAQGSGIAYRLLPEELELRAAAKLRVATDVMLHAQTNDAMSGTIRECVYAGAILVNPAWIRYEEFDALQVDYVRYASFSELTDCAASLLRGDVRVDTEKNTAIMGKQYSWQAVRADWEKAMRFCVGTRRAAHEAEVAE